MTTITISKNVLTTDTLATDVMAFGDKHTVKENVIQTLQYIDLDMGEYNEALDAVDALIASPKFNDDLSMNFDEEGKWITLDEKANFFIKGELIGKVAFAGNIINVPYYVKLFNQSKLTSEERLNKYIVTNDKIFHKYSFDTCVYFIFIGEKNAFMFLPCGDKNGEKVEVTFPLNSEDVLVFGSGIVPLIQQGYKPKSNYYIFDNIDANEVHRIASEFDERSNFDLRSVKV